MAERLSTADGSLIAGYGMHIQRYEFALSFCKGKRVLDAACGVGYGSHFLARSGAANVTGLDIANDALAEAKRQFQRPNLRFHKADLQNLDACGDIPADIDTVVSIETIEHLPEPIKFLHGVRDRLRRADGVFITTTPNGEVTEYDASGKIANPFHVREFTADEFRELLSPLFGEVTLYGQWQTNDALIRLSTAKQAFEQQCEAYYNPAARVGRAIKKLTGKQVTGPPQFTAAGESYSWEHTIAPLEDPPFAWKPLVILAVCKG